MQRTQVHFSAPRACLWNLPAATAPGDLIPSTGLCEHLHGYICTYVYTYIQTDTHTQIKINLEIFKEQVPSFLHSFLSSLCLMFSSLSCFPWKILYAACLLPCPDWQHSDSHSNVRGMECLDRAGCWQSCFSHSCEHVFNFTFALGSLLCGVRTVIYEVLVSKQMQSRCVDSTDSRHGHRCERPVWGPCTCGYHLDKNPTAQSPLPWSLHFPRTSLALTWPVYPL